jgi:hypothetical protein
MPDERASALQSFSTEIATRRYIDNGVSAHVEQARILYGTVCQCAIRLATHLTPAGLDLRPAIPSTVRRVREMHSNDRVVAVRAVSSLRAISSHNWVACRVVGR